MVGTYFAGRLIRSPAGGLRTRISHDSLRDKFTAPEIISRFNAPSARFRELKEAAAAERNAVERRLSLYDASIKPDALIASTWLEEQGPDMPQSLDALGLSAFQKKLIGLRHEMLLSGCEVSASPCGTDFTVPDVLDGQLPVIDCGRGRVRFVQSKDAPACRTNTFISLALDPETWRPKAEKFMRTLDEGPFEEIDLGPSSVSSGSTLPALDAPSQSEKRSNFKAWMMKIFTPARDRQQMDSGDSTSQGSYSGCSTQDSGCVLDYSDVYAHEDDPFARPLPLHIDDDTVVGQSSSRGFTTLAMPTPHQAFTSPVEDQDSSSLPRAAVPDLTPTREPVIEPLSREVTPTPKTCSVPATAPRTPLPTSLLPDLPIAIANKPRPISVPISIWFSPGTFSERCPSPPPSSQILSIPASPPQTLKTPIVFLTPTGDKRETSFLIHLTPPTTNAERTTDGFPSTEPVNAQFLLTVPSEEDTAAITDENPADPDALTKRSLALPKEIYLGPPFTSPFPVQRRNAMPDEQCKAAYKGRALGGWNLLPSNPASSPKSSYAHIEPVHSDSSDASDCHVSETVAKPSSSHIEPVHSDSSDCPLSEMVRPQRDIFEVLDDVLTGVGVDGQLLHESSPPNYLSDLDPEPAVRLTSHLISNESPPEPSTPTTPVASIYMEPALPSSETLPTGCINFVHNYLRSTSPSPSISHLFRDEESESVASSGPGSLIRPVSTRIRSRVTATSSPPSPLPFLPVTAKPIIPTFSRNTSPTPNPTRHISSFAPRSTPKVKSAPRRDVPTPTTPKRAMRIAGPPNSSFTSIPKTSTTTTAKRATPSSVAGVVSPSTSISRTPHRPAPTSHLRQIPKSPASSSSRTPRPGRPTLSAFTPPSVRQANIVSSQSAGASTVRRPLRIEEPKPKAASPSTPNSVRPTRG